MNFSFNLSCSAPACLECHVGEDMCGMEHCVVVVCVCAFLEKKGVEWAQIRPLFCLRRLKKKIKGTELPCKLFIISVVYVLGVYSPKDRRPPPPPGLFPH